MVCFTLSGLAVLDPSQALILNYERLENLLHRIAPVSSPMYVPFLPTGTYLFCHSDTHPFCQSGTYLFAIGGHVTFLPLRYVPFLPSVPFLPEEKVTSYVFFLPLRYVPVTRDTSKGLP